MAGSRFAQRRQRLLTAVLRIPTARVKGASVGRIGRIGHVAFEVDAAEYFGRSTGGVRNIVAVHD